MQTKQNQDKKMCRTHAAKYLGVAPNTLKSYPIPFVQYSRFGYALYEKSDLDKFKESRTFAPSVVVVKNTNRQGGGEMSADTKKKVNKNVKIIKKVIKKKKKK